MLEEQELTPYKAIQNELSGIVKLSPLSDTQAVDAFHRIQGLIESYSDKPDDMVHDYEQRCQAFLDAVIEGKGLPVRAVSSGDGNSVLPFSGDFNALIPALNDIKKLAIEKYQEQIQGYYKKSLDEYLEEVSDFLSLLKKEKQSQKDARDNIQALSKHFRVFIRWSDTFDSLKNSCFSSAIFNLFSIKSGAIGAEWNYSPLDEQCDYPSGNHKVHDKKVYIVRGSWADEDGFISSPPYLDDVIADLMDLGCSCNLVFLYNLRDIPDFMLSDKGRKALADARRKIADMNLPSITAPDLKVSRPETGIDIKPTAEDTPPKSFWKNLFSRNP